LTAVTRKLKTIAGIRPEIQRDRTVSCMSAVSTPSTQVKSRNDHAKSGNVGTRVSSVEYLLSIKKTCRIVKCNFALTPFSLIQSEFVPCRTIHEKNITPEIHSATMKFIRMGGGGGIIKSNLKNYIKNKVFSLKFTKFISIVYYLLITK